MEEKKHSELSIASFALSMMSISGIFGLLIQIYTIQNMDEAAIIMLPTIIAVFCFLSMSFSSAGVGLGIAGLLAKDRKKTFAAWGLGLSLFVSIVSTFAFMIVVLQWRQCNYRLFLRIQVQL